MKFLGILFPLFVIACLIQAASAQEDSDPSLLEDGGIPEEIAVVNESQPDNQNGLVTVTDVDQFEKAYFFNPKQDDVRFPLHKLPVLIRGTPRRYDVLIVVTDVFKKYAEVTRFWYQKGDGRFPRYYNIPPTVETTVYRVAAYFGKNFTEADDLIKYHQGLITRHVGIVGVGRVCNSSICANLSTQISKRARTSEWTGNLTHLNLFSPDKSQINQISGCANASETWPAVMKYARTHLGAAHFLFARRPNSQVLVIMRGDIISSQFNVMRAIRPGEKDNQDSSCWVTKYGVTPQGTPTQIFFFNLNLYRTALPCSIPRVLDASKVYCSQNNLLLSRWFVTLQRVV